MRRALAIIAISLFAVSASAAPRRDDDESLIGRIAKAFQSVVRKIGKLDGIIPPKG